MCTVHLTTAATAATFPEVQFLLQDFCMLYRLHRNRNGGGIMLYIIEHIPSWFTKRKVRNNVEYFFVEINLRKKKLLLCCSYNNHKKSILNYVDALRRELDIHSSNYENVLLLGDLNAEMTDPSLKEFCNSYSLQNLIKKKQVLKIQAIQKLLIYY